MVSIQLGGSDQSQLSDGGSPKNNEAPAVNEEDRCKYPSKFCGRARARKTNGVMHRFCQYHRLKANTNQKRWTSVRRQQGSGVDEQYKARSEYLARNHAAREFIMSQSEEDQAYWRLMGELPDPVSIEKSPEPVGLAMEDLHILHALFLSDGGGDYNMEPANTAPYHPAYTSMSSYVV